MNFYSKDGKLSEADRNIMIGKFQTDTKEIFLMHPSMTCEADLSKVSVLIIYHSPDDKSKDKSKGEPKDNSDEDLYDEFDPYELHRR